MPDTRKETGVQPLSRGDLLRLIEEAATTAKPIASWAKQKSSSTKSPHVDASEEFAHLPSYLELYLPETPTTQDVMKSAPLAPLANDCVDAVALPELPVEQATQHHVSALALAKDAISALVVAKVSALRLLCIGIIEKLKPIAEQLHQRCIGQLRGALRSQLYS